MIINRSQSGGRIISVIGDLTRHDQNKYVSSRALLFNTVVLDVVHGVPINVWPLFARTTIAPLPRTRIAPLPRTKLLRGVGVRTRERETSASIPKVDTLQRSVTKHDRRLPEL